MKICFYTPGYPGSYDSGYYAFVKQLVDAIADLGNECFVIAPYNVLRFRKFIKKKEEYSVGKGKVYVYRHYFISVSRVRSLSWLVELSRRVAIKKAIKQLPNDIDVVYGHFWISGYEAFQFAKPRNLPLFVASGESEITSIFKIPSDIESFRDYVKGVICVSGKNLSESVELGLTSADKCRVFPNAVNSKLFHLRDKMECRRQLGFSSDDFIVAFVGWFTARKGVLRVAEAINKAGNVKSVFIGKGEQEPQCEGILFKGALPHNEVPVYLCAADCFVLPTLAEGCCNAVIEAMACGLPVISSNLSFNWDVLDETNSIMVDPNNIDEISSAICTLRDNNVKRTLLAEGALKKAESLTIDQRSQAILQFIKNKI